MLDTDADQFDCETCACADARDALWPENAEAWRIFEIVATRFVHDLGLGNEVFRQCVRGLNADHAMQLTERLSLIYDVLYPPKPETD